MRNEGNGNRAFLSMDHILGRRARLRLGTSDNDFPLPKADCMSSVELEAEGQKFH